MYDIFHDRCQIFSHSGEFILLQNDINVVFTAVGETKIMYTRHLGKGFCVNIPVLYQLLSKFTRQFIS